MRAFAFIFVAAALAPGAALLRTGGAVGVLDAASSFEAMSLDDYLGLTACAWPLVTSPSNLNVAYPDSNAMYWTMPYLVGAEEGEVASITVAGTFPVSRFMSLTTYNAQGSSIDDASGAPMGLADYAIVPDMGAVNPWAASSPAGAPSGGGFTVKLAAWQPSLPDNTLPLLAESPESYNRRPANLGFLVFRVYLPALGNFSLVELPALTMVNANGSSAVLPQCSHARREQFAAAPLARALRAEVARGASGRESGDGFAPLVGASGASARRLAAVAAPTPPYYNAFFAPAAAASSGVFPNPANNYVALAFQPNATEVVVIRMRAPTSPWNVSGGTAPVPWAPQNPGYDMRYWSLCNNIYAAPYPVVTTKAKPFACLADLDAVRDGDGGVTVVLSRGQQPAAAANWLPFSNKRARVIETVLLRSMLVSPLFASASANAPAGASPQQLAAVMGAYYPVVAVCNRRTFDVVGAAGCIKQSQVA